MEFITTVDAREHFSELLNRSSYGKERIVLTRRGKNIAAVIPLEDLSIIEAFEDRLDVIDAKNSLDEVTLKGTISLTKFKENENIK